MFIERLYILDPEASPATHLTELGEVSLTMMYPAVAPNSGAQIRLLPEAPNTKNLHVTSMVAAGSSNNHLVRLIGVLSNPDWEARRLLDSASNLVGKIESRAVHSGTSHLEQTAATKWNAWQVADRLTADDVTTLIEAYLAGTTVRELAAKYGIGMTTVKRILRERSARRHLKASLRANN